MLVAVVALMPDMALSQDLPGDYISRRRTVQAGVKTRVWISWALTPDCQVIRGFNVKIVRTPQQGVATLEKVQQVIDQSWLNHAVGPQRLDIVRRCMGTSVATIGVFYTAEANASGDDSLAVVITNARQSHQRTLEIALAIRSSGAQAILPSGDPAMR